MTVDHLIENASERPYIAWPADFEAPHAIGKLDRFWRHVVHGTDLSAIKSLESAKSNYAECHAKAHLMISLNVGGIVGNGICDPKVNQFELASDEDKICRLEVRVYNLLLMDHMDGLTHLIAAWTSQHVATEDEENRNRFTCCQ
jgi:hypothetical protein